MTRHNPSNLSRLTPIEFQREHFFSFRLASRKAFSLLSLLDDFNKSETERKQSTFLSFLKIFKTYDTTRKHSEQHFIQNDNKLNCWNTQRASEGKNNRQGIFRQFSRTREWQKPEQIPLIFAFHWKQFTKIVLFNSIATDSLEVYRRRKFLLVCRSNIYNFPRTIHIFYSLDRVFHSRLFASCATRLETSKSRNELNATRKMHFNHIL